MGGDYFDVIPVEGKGVLLAIADVMGKGMPAALLATILRAAIRARLDLAASAGFLAHRGESPDQSDLAQLDMFITAQVAFLSYKRQQADFRERRALPDFAISRRAATTSRKCAKAACRSACWTM